MINSLELFIKKKDAIEVTKKWLDARRSYLQKLKSQAGLISGEDPTSISDYSRSNEKLYKCVWFKDSEEDFFEYCKGKKVILCGDFHSSPSVKRFYIRLFKRYRAKRRSERDGQDTGLSNSETIMALECFEKKHDTFLQEWLAQNISDEELLRVCNWEQNWGFNWNSYKKFMLDLKKMGFDLRAVNSVEKNLEKRDLELAQNLKALSGDGVEVFCLIGQHHLGPENLPQKLEQVLGAKNVSVSVHLDPEEIYFALEEYNLLKEVHVLKLENHFCFLSTPPWVHWQNHLLHLEGLYGEDLYDEEEEFECDEELRGEDYNAVVFDYLQLLKKDLEITEEINPIDVAFIDEYIVCGETSPGLYKIMQPMLDSETSFYWPEQLEGIMVRKSLNQAASVAGKYLHLNLMKVKELPWGEPETFEVWCWLEAVGHMLSKLINPKRSTVSAHNLSAFLSARLGQEKGAKLLKALIRERVFELDQSSNLGKSVDLTWPEIVYAARLKGALVGEELFELYSKGSLSPETLRTYLTVSIEDRKRFKEFYNMILQRLKTGR